MSGFLDSIIENIPMMLFVKEAKELRFERLNRAGEELLGIPRKELIGKSDYDFFPKDEADFFIQKDREVLHGKQLVDIAEEVIMTRDGERMLHTKKIPLLDEGGNPRYLVGISEDITEPKRTERRQAGQYAITRVLAEAERLSEATPEILRAVCESVGWEVGAIWNVDAESNLLCCVDVWHLAGVDVAEFAESCRSTLFPPGI